MISNGFWEDACWNETKHVYTFHTRSIIKFIAVNKMGKAKGPRRDVGFVNEANHAMSWEVFDQLLVRTSEVMWLDWNPSSEFWYYEHLKDKREHDFLTLTYLDCLEILDPQIVQDIESHKENKNWWKVYGLGQLGEIEGMIYKDWKIIPEIPHEARLIRTGLDFGYTNDESAIVDLYEYNNGYIVDEILYRKGMSNKQLVDTLQFKQTQCLVIADSAEPKSIDELRAYGINILPCTKGAGSVLRGIDFVKSQRISVTERSVNTIKEYRNYLWLTDKNGAIINEEDPACKNHAMSAIRYALDSLRPNESAARQVLQRRFSVNESNFQNNSTR
jgi:phage terminase large subunit